MMFRGLIRILLMFLQLYIGVCELLFPSITELNMATDLTCITQSSSLLTHAYSAPNSGTAATCSTIGTPCTILDDNYSATFFNVTQSLLTIYRVNPSHAGRWSCNIKSSNLEICDLAVMKTPTCNITSSDDTDALVQYQDLTLTVDVRDYYCSTAHKVSLQTGNVTTLLLEADSVPSVSDNTSSVTLNVTDSQLGTVGLVFRCNNFRRDLSCGGVNKLAPMTPTCDITSDKNTETLTLQEEVTLTVNITAYHDIRGSYCSVDSHFTLQTGDVTHLLNVGDQGLSPITFNVTKTHLGGVRLVVNCQGKHWNLSCDGVTELNNKLRNTAELSGSSTIFIIAGVVVAILLLIVVVIIIVLVAKRKAPESTLHPPSIGTVLQAEKDVVVGHTGSASVSDPRESGLRINPVYIPTTVCGGLESGGDNLHPESRGEYMALDRNVVQPSNIYEHLTTYEQIANL